MLPHKHLIIKAKSKHPPRTPESMEYFIGYIISEMDMKVAKGLAKNPQAYYCQLPGNEGITGMGILETSHIAIHVWDAPVQNLSEIQIDIYTCSELDVDDIYRLLRPIEITTVHHLVIDRENLKITDEFAAF